MAVKRMRAIAFQSNTGTSSGYQPVVDERARLKAMYALYSVVGWRSDG